MNEFVCMPEPEPEPFITIFTLIIYDWYDPDDVTVKTFIDEDELDNYLRDMFSDEITPDNKDCLEELLDTGGGEDGKRCRGRIEETVINISSRKIVRQD